MRRAVLLFAAAGSVLSVLYLLEGTRYALGTPAAPGPGLFPLIVSGPPHRLRRDGYRGLSIGV